MLCIPLRPCCCISCVGARSSPLPPYPMSVGSKEDPGYAINYSVRNVSRGRPKIGPGSVPTQSDGSSHLSQVRSGRAATARLINSSLSFARRTTRAQYKGRDNQSGSVRHAGQNQRPPQCSRGPWAEPPACLEIVGMAFTHAVGGQSGSGLERSIRYDPQVDGFISLLGSSGETLELTT
jgi:hypothetical protein